MNEQPNRVQSISPCPKCDSLEYYVYFWEDDYGHEDEKYKCNDCGYTHWIDGIDS